jgi:hypothetical protein
MRYIYALLLSLCHFNQFWYIPGFHLPSNVKPIKLSSYIKSIRTDNSGVVPLKRDGILVTDTVGKADILNNQLHSVFTNETDTDIPVKGHMSSLVPWFEGHI